MFVLLSLAQMQEYAALVSRGKDTIDKRVELLKDHLRIIDQRMEELARSRELLLAKLNFYRDWKSSGKRPLTSRMKATVHFYRVLAKEIPQIPNVCSRK